MKIELTPRFESKFVLSTEAIILKKLTNVACELKINELEKYDHINNLRLADPFEGNSEIDMILGAGDFARIIKPGLIKGLVNQPIAQNTEFGWMVSGFNSNSNKKK